MRSDIVFEALHTTNRFALCHLAFKAIRKLHKPNTRIQETTNDVFQRLAGAEGQQVGMEGANAIEQQQPAIEYHAGTPSAEPLAEAVDIGNSTLSSPAESPDSQGG
jgi:hypothetical protein